jgi:hypothetical protein
MHRSMGPVSRKYGYVTGQRKVPIRTFEVTKMLASTNASEIGEQSRASEFLMRSSK